MSNFTQLLNRISLIVIIGIILIGFACGFEIGVKPPQLSFEGKTNEPICKELNLIYTGEKIFIEIQEKWAKNLIEEDYNLYGNDIEDIEVDYPKYLEIKNDEKINVCITAKKSGIKKGVLVLDVLEKRIIIVIKMTLYAKEKDQNIAASLNLNEKTIYVLGFNSLLCFVTLFMLLKLQKAKY